MQATGVILAGLGLAVAGFAGNFFKEEPSSILDLMIDDTKIEIVSEYKYLRTVIDSKCTFG